jgi:hypothetical protein
MTALARSGFLDEVGDDNLAGNLTEALAMAVPPAAAAPEPTVTAGA